MYPTEKEFEKILQARKRKMLDIVRYKCKATGKAFDISVDDIEWPEYCPILNHKLNYFAVHSERNYAPSFDRVDNDLGYVKGNVKIISYEANRLKGNFTLEVFERLVDYIRGNS